MNDGRRWFLAMIVVGAAALLGEPAKSRGQDAVERDLIRAQADTTPPWLVMNVGGHTASVHALGFTPDGRRLCSGGFDKVVNVWDVAVATRDLKRSHLLERTLRWQVSRGLRGAVYTLAIAPTDGLLALAGYGATGGLGEIMLIDPVQNQWMATIKEHEQAISGLQFSPDGAWLVAVDLQGRTSISERAQGWRTTTVVHPDATTYGAEAARQIADRLKLRPLAVLNGGATPTIVVPHFAGATPQGELRWQVKRVTLGAPPQVQILEPIHAGLVTTLGANPATGVWASADLSGQLRLWTRDGAAPTGVLNSEGAAASLAFTPDGQRLVVGTAAGGNPRANRVQVWNLATRQRLAQRTLADIVWGVAVSPDGKRVAFSGGEHHEVYLGPIDNLDGAVALRGQARRVVRVAFAQEAPLERFAWGNQYTPKGFNDYGSLERSFDPRALELGDQVEDQAPWLAAEWGQGAWRAARQPEGGLQLTRDGQNQGVVSIPRELGGAIRSFTWIVDPRGEPIAIAAGTDGQNGLYVFGLAAQGECPLWRHFRGHNDLISSVGVSRDSRFLVSGSFDGTVRLWSLADVAQGAEPYGRWGAEWVVDGGSLRVARVHPAGPLRFKGIKAGDRLRQIQWREGNDEQTLADPAAIRERLTALPWFTQVVFEFERAGVALPKFQLLPAWQPLATLFVGANQEWAFWTPEGYYDASMNGHQLFGWQVNRGLDRLPEFFRADQFRHRLERPDVLERLLPAGNLTDAFEQARLAPPERPDEVVPEQIALTPRIDVLTPRAGELIDASSTTVRARVRLPREGELTTARVFANGVVARDSKLIERRNGPEGPELIYEWQANLPAEQRHLIQVFANASSASTGMGSVLIERVDPRPDAARPPRLYLLAVGINAYRDPAIQPLSYSVADAQGVVAVFESAAQGLYALEPPVMLTNEEVTPARWRETFTKLGSRLLTEARPDDLFIVFIAGHGFVDPITQRYYFAGHEITRQEFERGVYTSSIAWSDFELLADVPCRKLALLDTCHSGAIQQLRARNLKSAVRAFQQDVVLTLTASAGHEQSEENARIQHGVFTKALLDALDGKADASGDQLVTLDEVVDYVRRTVPQETAGRQNPTAGPDDLLPFVNLRLTAPGKNAEGVKTSDTSR